jgi:pSer/pThr/pTyr-binding forkhead associated (FHA) protein
MKAKLLIKRYGDAPEAPPLEERVFNTDFFSIGSHPSASVVLRGPQVAAEHVVVIQEDGRMLLFNRADGTSLNDSALIREARVHLAHGDRLRIGEYLIVFNLRDPGEAAPLTRETPAEEMPPPPISNPRGRDGEANTQRNFAAILNSLRNAEDSYNFLIEGGPHNQQRVIISGAEMLVGWDETGQYLAFDAALVASPRATVRKERSGVFVEARSVGTVAVNGEPVETKRRLKDGDRLMLVPTDVTAPQNLAFLVFHEPASLTVLNELRLRTLPPPVPLQSPIEMAETLAQADAAEPPAPAQVNRPSPWATLRRLNPAGILTKYYSTTELVVFAVCTLFLSWVFFLMFEFL